MLFRKKRRKTDTKCEIPQQASIGDESVRRAKSEKEPPFEACPNDTEAELKECSENQEYDAWRDLTKSRPLRVLFVLVCLSLVVFLLSLVSRGFAESYSRTVGGFLRKLLAGVSGVFPFSLAETALVAGLIFVVYAAVRMIVEAVRKVPDEERFERRFNRVLTGIVAICFSFYCLGFAPCNRRRSLADNLSLEREDVTITQICECARFLQEELQACLDAEEGIRYTPDGLSILPYSYSELSDRLNEVYAACYDAYPFLTRIDAPVKRVALSSWMTYTHISGIYIPYTGEANLNTNYPDYVTAFSAAHEMAHQRGIAHEDEANFMAFLVMYNSDDNYLRYAALLELYDCVLNAVYEEDSELFLTLMYQTPRSVTREIIGFTNFFTPYSGSAASMVADAVNDTAIKLRGDANGSESYDKMIDLAVAYFGF